MPGYLERTIEFRPGSTASFADQIHPRLDPSLWAMGHVALSAAQSEGMVFDPDSPAAVPNRAFYDTATGAGTAVLNLLLRIPAFMRAEGTYYGAHTDKSRTFRGMLIARQLDPLTDGKRCAEILGPARREQSVDAITIRYHQVIDGLAGVPLDATALHLAARLTGVENDHDQRAFVTNVATDDGTEFPFALSGMKSLTVTVGNVHDGGVVLPDYGRPSFEHVDRWAQALTELSRPA